MIKQLIQTYFSQPDELPEAVWSAVGAAVPGEALRVFVLSDLDARGRFGERWLVLTEHHLAVANADGAAAWRIVAHPLRDIEKLDVFDGLTSSRLSIIGRSGKLLETAQFTRRQSRAVGTLRFVAEQAIKRLTEKVAPKVLARDLDPTKEYQDAILKPVQDAKAMLAMPKMGALWRLLSYMRPHKKVALTGLCLSVAATLLQLLPPYLMRVLVDDVFRPLEKGHGQQTTFWLTVIIGLLAATWIVVEILQFVRMRIMALMGERISTQLREDVYAHLQRLSLSFFGSRTTGSLIARVSSDTDRLWDFITFGFLDIAMSLLQVVGVAAALLLQDWSLALLVLIPVPLMVLMFYTHGRRIHGTYLRIWRKWAAMTGVLSDVIPGIRVVKAFAQEDHEVDRFRAKSRAVEEEADIMHRQWTRFWPRVMMMMHVCVLTVWIMGAPRVVRYITSDGREGLPLGVFLAFTGYMWMFWGPVQNLGMMSRTLNRVTSSASRVFEVLDTVPTIVSKPGAVHMPPIRGRVAFDEVSFSYDGVRNVLKGVSFAVEPGEMIGLVGPSGGGKTTLVNLICRFYDVKDGSVRIDDADVRDLHLPSLRRQIGVVLQEPYLFHGTIEENIAYGAHGTTPREIIAAAQAANAHEFICGFPDGYETVVGERGLTLSGGERQRISIARAILHNPRLLILDEATSSVDTETEKKIQEALRRLVSGRTTFAIAHRLSTLSAASRLMVLEDGNLVEQGTHAELLAKPDGLYAKLHRTQMELQATMAI
jgi:ATP-binding cassette subfamily B protein